MKVKYITNTDSATIEFSTKKITVAKEINENISVDLDKNGNIVNINIEQVKDQAGLNGFSYEETVVVKKKKK